MQRNRILAILAAVGASAIYGLNHTVAKGVMPEYIGAFGLVFMRVAGAAAIFWILSLFTPKEKIERKDWGRLLLCALTGMVLNMLFFFKGLSLSTPINSSVIVTLSPVFVLMLSAIILKEKITKLKSVGIALGMAGALALVLFSSEAVGSAPNIPLGNTLFLVNAISFGVYLIVSKPLTAKYSPVTLLKWLFTIAVVINFPITISEFSAVEWATLPFDAIWRMLFVVIGVTVLTNLLNIYALKRLKASTLGAFMYLQPLIGIVYAVSIGADTLTTIKLTAGGLVFLGVYLVSKKPKSQKSPKKVGKRQRLKIALGQRV
jgi:drug/metabolite transporter (DMT)-like permease